MFVLFVLTSQYRLGILFMLKIFRRMATSTQTKVRESTMMKLMISAAAVIAVAAFTVPASADLIGGGPRVNTEGKCWKDNGGPRDARYGIWTACPKAASVNDSTCHLGQLAWEKLPG
jgi:hypothetical protein